MTSIYFFPWLDAPKTMDFGSVLLEPYERGKFPGDQELVTQAEIDEVMNFYKASPTENIQSCLMIRLPNKKIGEDLSEDEKGFLRVFAELLCFSHIAERTFFGRDYHYCCKEDFAFHGHGWASERFNGFIVIQSRRRDGFNQNMTDAESAAYHRPHNANKGSNLQEQPSLLQPLLQAFKNMDDSLRVDIYECIINYNLANTDNALITPEVEMVLLHSAFDAIFRKVGDCPARRAEVFQNYFDKSLIGVERLKKDSCLVDPITKRDKGKKLSLIEHWINDFKLTRGHCAHGGTTRNYPGIWSQKNHLVLGSFILPLLVKKRMESAGFYRWSHTDQANLAAFERFVQYDHFSDKWCGDIRHRSKHPWNRVQKAAQKKASTREIGDIIRQVLAEADDAVA